MKSYCRAMLAGCMCFSIRFGSPRVSRLATAVSSIATGDGHAETADVYDRTVYAAVHHAVVRRGLASLAHIGACIDDPANQAGIERKCEAQSVCWK